jgi:hypothetical protein
MAEIKHYATVVRIRIETALVEFDAPDDLDAATIVARDVAEGLPDDAWTLDPYDDASYRPHVHAICDEFQLAEFHEPGEVAGDLRSQVDEAASECRYLLLRGNLEDGSGDVIWQPWLKTDPPDLLSSDIAAEWIYDLRAPGIDQKSHRLDEIAGGAKPMPSDKILFAEPGPDDPKPRRKKARKPKKSGK